MTAQATENPFQTFTGLNGSPLTGGYVYFGEPDKDPRTFPVTVYYDEAMTVPATQPLRTTSGYIYRNGSPARVWVDRNYSTLVLDSTERQVFYAPDWTAGSSSSVGFLQGGTGAIERTVQAKLRESVSVADFGGVPGADCAAALILAAAATTGTILIPAGEWTCTATSATSDDILGILDRIRCDGTLVINLAAGTHSLTEQVVVNSPDAQRITIQGAATVSTTATSQVSVSGSAKAYSVIIGVASSAGAAVGDYAMIRTDITGTGDFYAHAGVWKITAVDSGGSNRLTLLNTHHGAAFPTNTLTGGTVVILKTMLQFTGCDGLRLEGGQPLGLLDRIALVGDWSVSAGTGTTGAHGIVMSAPVITGGGDSNAVHNMTGGAGVGQSVGVSAWGEQGIVVSGRCTMLANYIASCSNRKRGMYSEGGHIRSKFAICSGNGEDGFISDISGAIQANNSIASGNGLDGFWSTNHSILAAPGCKASGNLSNGFEARGLGRLSADAAIALNNGVAGFNASDGGMIDADGSTATGNLAHGFDAGVGAVIDTNNSTSTNNTGYGYRSQYGSAINATGATVSGNSIGNYFSRDSSVLFESSGALNVNDVATYVVAPRFYNSTKANYYSASLSSIGDMTWSASGTGRFIMKADGTFHPVGNGTQTLGRSTEKWSLVYATNLVASPPASVTPVNNGDVMFQLTSNTELTFKVKGSDGVVRAGSITLA